MQIRKIDKRTGEEIVDQPSQAPMSVLAHQAQTPEWTAQVAEEGEAYGVEMSASPDVAYEVTAKSVLRSRHSSELLTYVQSYGYSDELTTGIETVSSVPDVLMPVEYYSLQGMRLVSPQSGQVVIRRQGTSVSKLLVR